jgi:predicted nucleic-acid-binding protein
MKALDTNILVRFLVQDDKKQSQKVNQLLTQAEQSKQPLLVTSLVVLELIWVLDAVYSVSRDDIIHALNELLTMPALTFENQGVLRDFVNLAQNSNFDLSDLLIAQSGLKQGCDATITFDKKAAKFELFQAL